MVFSNKRRFIAGAICPTCKRQDTIMVFHEDDKDWQACVKCAFREALSAAIHTDEHASDAAPV